MSTVRPGPQAYPGWREGVACACSPNTYEKLIVPPIEALTKVVARLDRSFCSQTCDERSSQPIVIPAADFCNASINDLAVRGVQLRQTVSGPGSSAQALAKRGKSA